MACTKLLFCLLLPMLTFPGYARHPLKKQIQTIIREKNASVGVAVLYEGKELIAVNDKPDYPMMSTFKFPLALAVLDRLEKHRLPLDTEIYVGKSDLKPDTYSPLREKLPEGEFNMPVSELLRYCVSLSDNNAADILIGYIGGIQALQHYLNKLGISDMAVGATEEQMHRDPENLFLNTTRPSTSANLMERFMDKRLLSAPYQSFLERILTETATGTDKLKGLLPVGTVIGHKTGSSDRNDKGIKLADNDMGFVLLPDGKRYTIAVFIKNSIESDKANADIIARISKAVYDYYNKGKQAKK